MKGFGVALVSLIHRNVISPVAPSILESVHACRSAFTKLLETFFALHMVTATYAAQNLCQLYRWPSCALRTNKRITLCSYSGGVPLL